MRTIIKILLLPFLVAITNFTIAQSSAPWTLNGNSNAGNGNRLGTLNFGIPLNIYSGGTQRMIILDGSGTNSGFVGIGNGFTNPTALFHINGTSNTGEVFRTTSSTNVVSAWRMLKGNGANAEKFAIYVPANSNDVILQALQGGGKMFFKTSTTATTRMTIIDGNLGYVGIGPCSA